MRVLTLPEEKLNQLAQDASEKLFANHYFDQGIIKGEQLKTFSDYSQINKFLLFQVYQVWNMQIGKLNHPYFDFDQPEIQESLKSLRNQLSQHIKISKDDFKPMLKRAVYNNLKLLIDPKETFASFFFVNRDQTSIELYERYAPFFSDMDFVVNSILQYHKKHQMDTVEKEIFFLKMDKVLELYDKKSQISFDDYRIGKIRDLSGADIISLIKQAEAEAQALAEKEKAEKERMEAEAARLAEEEKRRQEEERLQQLALEEEAKRKELSFFDTIEKPTASFFEIEEEQEAASANPQEIEKKAEEENTTTEQPVEMAASPSETTSTEKEAAEIAQQTTSTPPVEAAVEQEKVSTREEQVVHPSKQEPAIQEEEVANKEVVTPVETATETTPPAVETSIKAEEVNEPHQPEVKEEVQETDANVQEEAKPVAQKQEATTEEAPKEPENKMEEEETDKIESIVEKLSKEVEQKSILDSFGTPPKTDQEEDVSKPKTIAEKLASQQKENKPTESTESFLDRFISNKKAERNTIQSEDKTGNTPKPPVENKVEVDTPTPKTDAPAPKKEVESTKDEETVFTPKKIIDQPAISIPVLPNGDSGNSSRPLTIADAFQKDSPKQVHESINGNAKIKLNEIPIHKQYQFVQKVFEGNNVRFRIIVDKVNNAQNSQEVDEIIQRFVLNNDNIDQNDQVVRDFVTLLKNRF